MLSQRTLSLALGLLFAGLIAAVSGCASGGGGTNNGPFICGPDTCTGCCQGNNCVAPPDETACGNGGAACAPCRANEACTQGMCVPDNCAGCVDPTSLSCLPGTAMDKCGTGGAFCASCGAGTACQAGRCSSTVCNGCKDSGGACQTGTTNAVCGTGGANCTACTSPQTCQDHKCVAPAACTTANCTGCCNDSDVCVTTPSLTACGTGGNRCAACSGAGATCTAGACKTPCGPANCQGCCKADGTCVASVTATCGNNGVMCTACAGTDICSNGSCISTNCKSTCPGCCMGTTCQLGNTGPLCGASGNSCVACTNGQVCNNGTCHVDPNSLWDFVVTTADVPLYNNPPTNNSTWDSFGGLPDPYVELDLDYAGANQLIGTSDSVSNTITPDWSMTTGKGVVVSGVKASLLLQSNFLQVWDSDAPLTPDDMGYCTFHINETNFGSGLWMFTCAPPNNSHNPSVSWVVRFRIVPHVP